ncbi:hypothetical protein TSH58p_08200 [Azospirillum sp. TSH58]|uniref:hypothetical protein n=1 Tax=Azospirillum sp. TSH58 TaxID=664962 RepID=UPI000D6000F3|nr:hypothetical protein [Azospirillum sp. TSH58]AWJ83509.1 hypothetical protein TSH58p_08200 [Azospirillum sp. TSH58]PWC65446.1 hypothetical protein TSH58_21015 [Azospirillum sp. TSH58]
MSITDVTGGTPAAFGASAKPVPARGPDASTSGTAAPATGRGGAVDTVTLSREAVRAMKAGTISFTVPMADGAAAKDPVAAGMDAVLARRDYDLKQADYMREAMGMLRQTLNLPEDQPIFLGGAAHGLLEKLAAKNGLSRPEMPDALRAAGVKDPFAEDAGAEAGVIGVGMPNSGKELQVVFDRLGLAGRSAKTDDPLRMIALKDGNDHGGPLLGAIKGGTLGRLTDTRPGQGASLWAVTDEGEGPNARVLASVRSVGMDGVATDLAAGLLKGLKGLFAGS